MGRYITTTGTAGSVVRINAGVNYQAIVNDRIICTAGGQTITLPASGTSLDGDTVQIIDANGTFAGSNCTVNNNGANIQGANQTLTLNVSNATVTLVYSTAVGWIILK
jgi:hypothetical protein